MIPNVRENPIFWIAFAVTVEQAVSTGLIQLTNMIPLLWIPVILAWCKALAIIGTSFIAALAHPSVATKTAKAAAQVAIVILFAMAFSSNVLAATVPMPKPRPQAAAVPPVNGLNLKDPLQRLMNDLANIKSDIINGTIDDLNAADAQAQAIDPNTQQMTDPIAHACYPAMVKFLQGLPTATPLTGKFVLVQIHERTRIFALQIRAGIPTYLKLGCAPLLGDDLAIVTQALGLVGVKIATGVLSGGALPALLPLP